MAFTETKKRANSCYTFAMSDGKLTWDYGPDLGKLTLDPDKVSAVNRHRAMHFGLKQRCADKMALGNDTDTGKPATAQAKRDAMARIIEHLESGSDDWNLRAPAARDDGLTVQGVMRAKDWTIERVEAWIVKVCDAKGIDRKAVLANAAKNPDVIRAIADIKAERAADSDAQDYLDEMEDDDAEG